MSRLLAMTFLTVEPGERLRNLSGVPAKNFPQFALASHQYGFPAFRKIASGAVDIKVQHGHDGLIRRGLAFPASLRGAFQGRSNSPGIIGSENSRLQFQRAAVAGHLRRPS